MKSDKQKLFEAFEKVCKVKLIKESEDNILEEGWKSWAVSFGLAAGSLLSSTDANAQLNIKNKLESIINNDLTLKKLEKEGYIPEKGAAIDKDRSISDSGIEAIGGDMTNARAELLKILKDEKINYLNPRIGFIVYKKESPTRVRAKWINYN
jgi:hypothetical protein